MAPLDNTTSSARHSRKPQAAGLGLEPLEPRVLLSSDQDSLHVAVLQAASSLAQPPLVSTTPLVMSAAAAGPADPAPPVTGTIATPGQTDQYTFTLNATKSLYFDSLTNNGSLNWSLTGPSGTVVSNRSFNGSDGPQIGGPAAFSAPAGNYTLSVSGSNAAMGDYGFRLLDLSKATPIAAGVSVSDTLNSGTRTDAYSFSGTAGQRVYLDAQSGNGLYWRMLDQYGQLVSSNYFSDMNVTLPSTGTYTLLVEGGIGNTAPVSFTYTLFPQADTTQAMSLDTPIIGTIAQPGQLARYTFTLGQETLASLNALSPSSGLQWTLQGPRGTEIDHRAFTQTDSYDGNSTLDLPAGSYTLTVSGSGASTGKFGFQLLTFANATPTAYGSTITGTLGDQGASGTTNPPGTQTRLYGFSAKAGDQVQLNVGAATNQLYYRLFDPFGREVQEAGLNTGTTTLVTLPIAGAYTLAIEGRVYNTSSASYSLTIAHPSSVTPPALTGTAMTLGTAVTGTVAATGETDDYVFTVSQPTRLLFTPLTTTYGTNLSETWQLDGPQGNLVAAHGFSGNTRVDVTAPGTYRIRIGNTTAGQNFSFLMQDLAAATAMTPGTAVTASLSPNQTAALFSFAGTAGQRVFARALSNTGSLNWRLIDPFGRDVFNTGFSDQGVLTLAATGTYTVAVFGTDYNRYSNGTTPSNFSFNIDPTVDNAAALTLGTAINGTLAGPGDTARYNFSLAAASQLYLAALTQDGNVTWTLTGPRGTEISNTGLYESNDQVLNLVAGTYTLTVARNGNGTGAFGFQLSDLGAAPSLAYNATATATLAPAVSAAAWQFAGTAGDRIYLDGSLANNNGARLKLVDPYGQTVLNTSLGASGIITLASTGTFHIVTEAFGYDTSASTTATISLYKVVDPSDAISIDGPALLTSPVSVPGQIGTALKFTGPDYVSVPNSAAIDQRSTATIEFWLKPDAIPNAYTSLVYKGDGNYYDNARTYSVWMTSTGGIYFSTQDAQGETIVQSAANSVQVGTWTHVAAVMDRVAGTLSIYLNGVLAASAPVRTTPANGGAYPLLIGYPAESNAAFSGSLDDLRIYGTARTAAAIAGDFKTALTGNEAGLALYLPFDDATGATGIADKSANAASIGSANRNAALAGAITGQITQPGQAHRYTFTLTQPTQLVFDALTDNSNLTVTLTGPNGLTVQRNMRNGDSFEFGSGNPVITAPAGSYTITVTDNGDRTDAYAFRFVKLGSATPIAVNTPVTSTLAQGGATQLYSFSATAGDKFLLDVLADNKGSDRTDFRLIDPFGNQILGPVNFQDTGPFTVALTGTYTLLVEGRVWDQAPLATSFQLAKVVDQTTAITLGTNPNPGPIHAPGQIGGALRFTGSDTVTVPGSAALNLTSNVTLEAWINVDRMPPNQWSTILYKGVANTYDGTGRTYSLWLNRDGSIYLGTAAAGGGTQGLQTAAGLVTTGQWIHVAGVIDRTNGATHLYVNGVDVADGTIAATLAPSDPASPLMIGGAPEPNGAYADFMGRIDEIRIWNVARTASQIAAARSNALTGTEAGLALYLPFDEASGLTAADRSTNAATATLQQLNKGGITGQIAAPGQTVSYTFTLPSAILAAFDSQTQLNSLNWTLTGPNGTVVDHRPLDQSNDKSAPAMLSLPAGAYTLSVRGNGDATGWFNIALLDLAKATPITPGTAFTVDLNPGERTQAFSFTATAGQRVLFDVTSHQNDPQMRLIDPSGHDVLGTVYSSQLIGEGVITLAQSGTYTMVWGDQYSDLNRVMATLTVTPVVDKTATLTPGTAVSGSIDVAGQSANYGFSLASPARLLFDSLTNDGNLNWTLTGPNGTLVSARAFTQSDSYDVGPAELDLAAGSYTLSVRANSDSTGAFGFNLLDMSAATALTANVPVNVSLPARTTRLFSYTGQAGDRVQFFSAANSGDVTWRLFDPNGNQLFSPTGIGNEPGVVTLTSSGSYILAVEGRIYTAAAASLTLQATPIAPANLSGSVAVDVPANQQGLTDLGYFAAGTYTITGTGVASVVGGGTDPSALLFNPDGTVFTPTQRSGYTYFNTAPSDRFVPNNSYGIAGAGFNGGALLGSLVANPAAADYFTIGRSKTVTLASAGHIYAVVNDVPNAYGDNNYGFTATVTPSGAGTPGTTQRFDGTGGTPYSLNTVNNTAGPQIVASTADGHGQVLRLTSQAATNQTNVADFSGTATGPFGAVTVEFDARITPGTTPGLGLAAVLLDTSVWGNAGPSAGYANIPQVTGGLAVKLSVSNDGNNNQVALTWNGNTISTAAAGFSLSDGTWDHVTITVQRATGGANVTVTLTPTGGAARTVLNNVFVGGYGLNTSRLALVGLTDYRTADQDVDNVSVTTTPLAAALPTLAIGTPVTGALTQAGATASYGFDVAAPTRAVFDSLSNDYQLSWTIMAADGRVVASQRFDLSNVGQRNANPSFNLAAGHYTLTVFPTYGDNHTGNYGFSLLDLASATALTSGTKITGTLNPGNGTALYRFSATAGDRLAINGVSGWNGTQYYVVLDPNGQVVVGQTGLYNGIGPFKAGVTGTYTLVLQGNASASSTSSYGFTLTSVPADTTQALTLNAAITATLASGGQAATYTFTLPSARSLYFDGQTNTGNLNWAITDQYGHTIQSSRPFNYGDQGPFLCGPGVYTLTITSSSLDASGTAAFALLDLTTAGTALTVGTPITGTLTPGAATIAYALNATAGQSLFFDTTSHTGSVTLQLIDPAGNSVFASGTDFQPQGLRTLALTGRYTLLVEGGIGNTSPASYAFTVVQPTATTHALTLGAVTTGSLSTPGGQDSYGFTLTGPTRVLLSAITDGIDSAYNGALNWTLTGPNGFSLGRPFNNSAGTWLNGTTPAIALAAGSYTLSFTTSGNQTGTYSFALLDLAAAKPITLGTPVSVALNPGSSSQLYAFAGTSGDRVYFQAGQYSGGSAIWRLIDPNNNQVFSTSLSSSPGQVVLPATGTYVVSIEGYIGNANQTTATDTFTAFANPAANAIPIASVNSVQASDLVVQGLTATASPQIQSGSTMTVAWSDVNTGAQPTDAAWTDRVIVRRADTQAIIANVTLPVAGPLAAGARLPQSKQIALPDGAPGAGALTVTVTTDSGNTVHEQNADGSAFTNNTATLSVTSALAAYPDLTVGQVALSPASGYKAGDTVTASWVLSNTGTAATGVGFTEQIAIRNTLTNQVIVLTTDTVAAGFAAGATANRSLSFTWPAGYASTGAFVVSVTADSTGQVIEAVPFAQRTDNTGSANILSAPDLGVTGLAVTNTAALQSGDTLSLAWTDSNTGNAATPANWTDRVRIVNTTTGATLLDQAVDAGGPLAAGGQRGRTFSFKLPDGAPGAGSLSISVTADGSANLEATASGNPLANNTQSVTATSTARTYPDLVPTLTAPSAGTGGSPVAISWTVTNAGPGATKAGTWTDKVILSTTPTIGAASDVVLGSFTHTGDLTPGGTYTQSQSVTLPGQLAGTYYITVVTDAGQAVVEPDTRSHTISVAAAMTVSSSYAALAVGTVTAPATASSGGTVTLSWTVANTGTGATNVAAWQDRIYLSQSTTPQPGDPVIGTVTHNGTLAAGGSYTATATLTLPAGVAGSYRVLVLTDATGQVYQAGHTGGTIGASSLVAIQSPDLKVPTVTAPTALQPGQYQTITWTVQNAGLGDALGSWYDRVLLSTNGSLTGATVLADIGHGGGLAAGGSYTASALVRIPSLGDGAATIFVVADNGNTVFEANGHTDNVGTAAAAAVTHPNLAASAVTAPATANSGSAVNVSWTVTSNGTAPAAGSWNDQVFIVRGTTLDGTQRYLGSLPHTGTLAPGSTYTGTLAVQLPSDLADGTYHLIVVANGDAGLDEGTARADNVAASAAIGVAQPPLPDLKVTGLAVTPDTGIRSGNTLAIGWNVNNAGAGATSSSFSTHVTVVNATTGQTIADQQVFYDRAANGNIAAGSSAAQSLQVKLPDGAAGVGQIVVTVTADSFAQVYEGAGPRTDNTASISRTSTLQDYPDLTVDGLAVSPAPVSGGTLTIGWTTANHGGAPVRTAFGDRVVVINQATGQTLADQTLAYDPATSGALAAGAGIARSLTVKLPDGTAGAGQLLVRVIADAQAQVPEFINAGRTDNVATATVTAALAAYPALTVSKIVVPTTTQAGATVTISYTVTNNGSATATGTSQDVIALAGATAASDTALLTLDNPALTLAAGASITRTAQITIPANLQGTANFAVITDATSRIFQLDRSGARATSGPVIIQPALSITLSTASVAENAGTAALTATVARSGSTTGAITVTLVADPSVLTAPATVTIPSGQSGATVTLGVVDDGLVTGSRTGTLTASAAGLANGTASVSVTNTDIATLTLATTQATVAKNTGSMSFTLTRNAGLGEAQTVTLTSDDATRILPPPTVSFAAGQASATFTATVLNNGLVEGLRQVNVNALATGYVAATSTVTITDSNVPSLTLGLGQTIVSESAGSTATTLTITRDKGIDNPVELLLQTNIGQIRIPAHVGFAAGQSSVSIPVAVLNNQTPSTGSRVVAIQASVLDSGIGAAIPGTSVQTLLQINGSVGPTLGITLDRPTIAGGTAVTATVMRSGGDNTKPLTVVLNSNNTTEATVPTTVTFAANQTTAQVTVNALNDGAPNSSTNVTLTADAGGYIEGSAGLVVTNRNLPDLQVSNVTVAPSVVGGQTLTVSYTVTNTGTLTTTAPWIDRVFLASDVVLTPASVLVGTGNGQSLAPGQSYTGVVTFKAPDSPGSYNILVQTNADTASGVQELNSGNNFASAPLTINPSFRATVAVGAHAVPGGNAVSLSGTTYDAQTNAPVPFKIVSIKITALASGVVREVLALTDSSGHYSTKFTPISSELGDYTVTAAERGVTNTPVQDNFSLIGATANTGGVAISGLPGVTYTGSFQITNGSSVPLTGWQASFGTALPATTTFVVQPVADLAASTSAQPGTTTIRYSFTSTVPAVGTSSIVLRSAEGAVVTVPVTVNVIPAHATLVTNPGSLDTGMVVGSKSQVTFTITNTGGADSGPVTITLPNVPYMSLGSPATIDNIAVGATATVTVNLTPAADLTLQQYKGAIAINSATSSTTEAFTLRAVTTAVGDATIAVQDEYSFFAADKPLLAGAHITVADVYSGQTVAKGTTDATGMLHLTGLAAGAYTLIISADQHTTFNSTIIIKPGTDNQFTEFLHRQAVSYTWTVVPVQQTDSYTIKLQADFQTAVPMPVVTVDQPWIVALVSPGRVWQTEITLTNHGLIDAKDVSFNLPNDPNYSVVAMVDHIDTLPAGASVTVPILISMKPGASASDVDVSDVAGLFSGVNQSALGSTQTVRPSALGGTAAACLGIEAKYTYVCQNHVWVAVQTNVDLISCGDAIFDQIKGLATAGNLLSVGCDTINTALSCLDHGDKSAFNDACVQAALNAACKAAVGFVEGGPGGAAAAATLGSWQDWLKCLCAHFPNIDVGAGDGADLPEDGGPGGIGGYSGYGGALSPYDTPIGWATPTTCDGTPASSASTQSTSGAAGLIASQDNSVCATVRLEIDQKATITRTAFSGTLDLNNGDAANALQDVSMDITITDINGVASNDKFSITGPDTSGFITGADGKLQLQPSTDGKLHFIFLPTQDAAPNDATSYNISGILHYVQNGVKIDVTVSPARIYVYPEAHLQLNYFWQRDVIGDDPFTPQVEPSEPFYLGVQATNVGKGTAGNLTITSAQPQIVENEKGLLIDFRIVGSQVGNQPGSNSLTVDLGTIAPGQTVSADWALLSSLQGKFKNYSASFTHDDDKGNLKTSLIDSVAIHELIQKVQVTPDGTPSFLTSEVPDANHDPDTLWLGSGGQQHVSLATGAKVAGAGGLTETLTVTQASGWSYFTVADPAPGLKLVKITRSDGKDIPIGGMAWRSDRTWLENQPAPVYENLLHILDLNGTGSYTLTYASDDHVAPQVVSLTAFSGVQSTGPDEIDVQLNKPIDDTTFTAAALGLTLNGAKVPLSGLTITDAGNGLIKVTGLAPLAAANGNYVFSVDATQLKDSALNVGTGSASTSFAVSNGPAVALAISTVTTPRNTPVGALTITFSKPIAPAGIDARALSLTRNGTAVVLDSRVSITPTADPTVFRIDGLGTLAAADGTYVLTVNAGQVTDTTGTAGTGRLASSWTMNTVGPVITTLEAVATNPRNTIVPTLNVTLSEPIDPASFDYRALTVTKDGGTTNLVTSHATVTRIDDTHYQLAHFNDVFDATQGVTSSDQIFNGTYTLTVDATKLRDLAGNAGTGNASQSWTIGITPPATPTSLAITPDRGASTTDGVTNTTSLTISGNLGAAGLTVRLTDLTTNTELGYATVVGTHFAGNVALGGPGSHKLRVRAIDAAGNTADSTIDLFIDTTAPTVQSFSTVSPNPRTTALDSLDVTFTKAIDPATFTAATVQLTRDGNAVALSGVTITNVGGNTYRIAGLTPFTAASGAYSLSLAGGIADVAGNALAGATAQTWTTSTTVRSGFGGVVYQDFNGDGARAFGPSLPSYDTQETGLSGWTVFIDAKGTGVFDATDPSTTTAADGSYSFGALAAGTYTVRLVPQAGWISTGATSYTITVTADSYATASYDFGSFKLGQVSGTVFSDANANGVLDNAETPLANVTVFVDRHGDGVLHADDPSVVTGADGRYSFDGIDPGTLLIGEVTPSGYVRTTAQSPVTVQSGYVGQRADIGNTAAASITGNVFDDFLGTGLRTTTSAALSGWTVFLDTNNNGLLDTGEQSTVSATDGSFGFFGLLPGTYSVRIVQKSGYLETTPAAPGTAAAGTGAQSVSDASAAAIQVDCACGGTWAVQGGVDLGAESVADAANLTALTQSRQDSRFAQLFGQGMTTVVIDTGIDNNHPFFGPETNTAGRADRIVYEYDFADDRADASDHNGHGSNVASLIASSDGTYPGVAPDANLIVLKVFDDNGNGNFGYVKKALDWVLANASAYHINVVNMSFGDGGNWTSAASRYGLGDDLAAISAAGIVTVAAAGNNYAQFNSIGVAYPGSDPSVVAVGSVWSGDFGGPWRVSTGAVDYTTGADHIAAYSQRDPNLMATLAPGSRFNGANANGGVTTMQGSSQAAAYVSGAATLAQQLALKVLGRGLTTAEFAALLRSTGDLVTDGAQNNDNVRNTGLTFPRLDMEKLFNAILAYNGKPSTLPNVAAGAGTASIAPAASGPGYYRVTLTAGTAATGKDFGQFKLGTVAGTVFDDTNRDGKQEAGEAGLGGVTVFIDAKGTGTLDAADPQTVTASDGSYSFGNIGPGAYKVAAVLPSGQVATSPDPVALIGTSGLAAQASFGLAPPSVAPVVTASGPATTTIGATYTISLSVQDPGQTVTEWYVDWGDGTLQGITGNPSSATHQYTQGGKTYTIAAAVRDATGLYDAAPFQVAVAPPQQVVSVAEDASSVSVRFNDAFDPMALHLYAVAGATTTGGPSVTLVGARVGAVAGSLVFDADLRGFTFVKTGGVLAADTYTLTLVSGANGFHDALGGLDGTGAGTVGSGNYTTTFAVGAPAAVVSLPDFMRAAGQSVDYAIGKAGLPITLTNAAGLTSLDFHLDYDPSMLVISGIVPGSGQAGITLTLSVTAPGHAVLHMQSPAPLGSGAVTLGALQAAVPATAAYGRRQLIRLTVDGSTGASVTADDALQVSALLGDTNGNADYDAADATLVQRVVLKTDSGFGAWPDVDPVIVADVLRTGALITLDATRIGQQAATKARPEFAPMPSAKLVADPRTLVTGQAPAATSSIQAASLATASSAFDDALMLQKKTAPMQIKLAQAFSDFALPPTDGVPDWQKQFLKTMPAIRVTG